jgi:hypothetical protein
MPSWGSALPGKVKIRQYRDWQPRFLQITKPNAESLRAKDEKEPIRRLAFPGLALVQRAVSKLSSTSESMIHAANSSAAGFPAAP